MSNSTDSDGLTADEVQTYDAVAGLAEELWAKSREVKGMNTDPKMMSVMLFARLWSNYRGYTLLHNAHLNIEADTVLRSAIEAGICIAANFRLRDEFVTLMRLDAAFTVQSQIKMFQAEGDVQMMKEGESTLAHMQRHLPGDRKPAKLDWKSLAQQGQVPMLYGFHRRLSGLSSHITGMSIVRGVVGAEEARSTTQDELAALERKMHPLMMMAAGLQGSMIHAGMIESPDHVVRAAELTVQVAQMMAAWPED